MLLHTEEQVVIMSMQDCNSLEQPIYMIQNGQSGQFTSFDQDKRSKVVSLQPGEKKNLIDSDATGLITRIWFTFPGWFWQHWNAKFPVDPTILKQLILRIYWDGNAFPSVEAPIGDFFGIGHCEYRHYLSKYLGMSSGGFYCYFPMPFSHGIRLELENMHGALPADVFMNVNYRAMQRLPDHCGRFHCQFNCGHNSGTDPFTIFESRGRGHYAGCCLSMQGESPNYLSFLEAPEYFYIDTEDMAAPSIVGTGLEDYFNGGWYFRNGEFHGALHGVPLKDSLRSMISMYRFHELDAITFSENIKLVFRNPMDPERLKPFKFSSTAYWYQDQAAALAYPLPAASKLIDLYRIRDTDHQSIP
jgi:hypothetical protein